MRGVSTAQTVCAMGISVALHASLIILANESAPPLTPDPIEEAFHLELTTVETESESIQEFLGPNHSTSPKHPSPAMTRQVENLDEVPRLSKALAPGAPFKQPPIEEIPQDMKAIEPKTAPAPEHFVPTQLAELSSEDAIKKLDPSDKTPVKPIPPILPTHDVPLQITEIDSGYVHSPIKPKSHVLEPTSTRPVQSEPLLPMPQEASNIDPVSQREKTTDPAKPIENPDFIVPALPNKPVQPSYHSEPTQTPNNISPAVMQATKLALKPLAPVPQTIDRSREDLVLSVPIPERVLRNGKQKREEKQAISQYVTLLHNAISDRARRDYPSRAIKRGEEGRVLAQIKVDSNGELLEIKISNESTASNTLIRAAERAIKREAPFAQFAQAVSEEARWFKLSLNYRINSRSD